MLYEKKTHAYALSVLQLCIYYFSKICFLLFSVNPASSAAESSRPYALRQTRRVRPPSSYLRRQSRRFVNESHSSSVRMWFFFFKFHQSIKQSRTEYEVNPAGSRARRTSWSFRKIARRSTLGPRQVISCFYIPFRAEYRVAYAIRKAVGLSEKPQSVCVSRRASCTSPKRIMKTFEKCNSDTVFRRNSHGPVSS